MTRVEKIGNATLYLGDSLQVLQSLAAGTADAVITDFDIACRRIREAVDGDRMFAQAAPVQLGLEAA